MYLPLYPRTVLPEFGITPREDGSVPTTHWFGSTYIVDDTDPVPSASHPDAQLTHDVGRQRGATGR